MGYYKTYFIYKTRVIQLTKPSHVVILNMCKNKIEPMAESQTKLKVFLHIHKHKIIVAVQVEVQYTEDPPEEFLKEIEDLIKKYSNREASTNKRRKKVLLFIVQ